MTTLQLSPYQEAVLKWAREHRVSAGALQVEAKAGSGKTFTNVQMTHIIPESAKAVSLAFNKRNADELAVKMPDHVESKTINSLGWGVCRWKIGKHIKVDRNKTRDLIRKHLPQEAEDVLPELLSLIAKAKAHGLIPSGRPTPSGTYEATGERWQTLMERYDIDPGEIREQVFFNWADTVLTQTLENTDVMDFDDQLYIPVALDLPTWKYDWIIIDEAQDVSHVQRTLIRKFAKPSSKVVAVGDTNQAIYGFRGADSESMANLRRVFKMDQLPLSICYRCPKRVVAEAQQYVPDIEAHEDAEDGEILRPSAWDVQSFSDDDLVICRNTAPLIELAYKCIADGKKVHVMGREIGQGLVNVIRKAGGKYHATLTLEELQVRLNRWEERQRTKAKDDESKLAAISDKLDCIRILSAECETGGDVIKAIQAIFDERAGGTTLATIHKAKGAEAPRVFILEPDLVPSPWARKPWQQQQERNLAYVAITRALETLVYLPLDIVS